MRFLDTNVLIYAVSTAEEDAGKRSHALELLGTPDLALSVQVLQEFYVQSTCPSRLGALTHDEAVAFAEAMQRFPVQGITLDIIRAAFVICDRSASPTGIAPFLPRRAPYDAMPSIPKISVRNRIITVCV